MVKNSIGELNGLLKVAVVTSAKRADRDKRKTVILEGTSQPYNAFRGFFDNITRTDSDAVLSAALRLLWHFFPYWQELDGRVGNAEDPGDGLLYDDSRVNQANFTLQELHKAWINTEALSQRRPPPNLPRLGKICLVLTGMQQQNLLQDFIDSGCEDKDLPFRKERLEEVLKPQHRDYAATFATEQYRAVPRQWEAGQHLEIDEEEPLPLVLEKHYDNGSYGRVYRVRDFTSGHRYARKDQITTSDYVSAAARRHLEEETKRLKDLEHRHIVQVVKTYQRGKAYGILLRPAATSDLQKLLGRNSKDKFSGENGCKDSVWLRPLFLTAFGCLSRGLAYIHDRDIRHKDVKPANILYERASSNNDNSARFLWADFGLAYDFSETGNSKTKSTKLYSPRYAAPEIVTAHIEAENQDRRGSLLRISNLDQIVEDGEDMLVNHSASEANAHGRAADVFSLGCVFLELLAGLVKESLPLRKHQQSDEKIMFSHNIPALLEWAQSSPLRLQRQDQCVELKPLFDLAARMINPKPNNRPIVNAVVEELVAAQRVAAGSIYFCEQCRKELSQQKISPSKSSANPSPAPVSPSSDSPHSPKRSPGAFLLERAATGLSVKNVRPRLSRILSGSNREKPI